LEKALAEARTGDKKEQAKRVGKLLAERARDKQIERVRFDRSGYLFHGRVQALADAAREAGLAF
jgi:large subunit ribosomal protein L18